MKSLIIKFYTPHLKKLYTFQNAKYYITVAKTCEKILRLDMTSTTKVKVEYIGHDFNNKSESRIYWT